MSEIRFEIGKTYRYKRDKRTYRLELILPADKGTPGTIKVLYLAAQGVPMMAMPISLAPTLLQPYEGPGAGGQGGVDADDPLDA